MTILIRSGFRYIRNPLPETLPLREEYEREALPEIDPTTAPLVYASGARGACVRHPEHASATDTRTRTLPNLKTLTNTLKNLNCVKAGAKSGAFAGIEIAAENQQAKHGVDQAAAFNTADQTGLAVA